MSPPPNFTPFSRGPGMSFMGWISLLLVATSVYAVLKVRTVWSVLISFGLFMSAYALQKMARSGAERMAIELTPLGIIWIHPSKGKGIMRWANVGALSVSEDRAGGGLGLILVPLNPEEGQPLQALSPDFSSDREEGKKALIALAGELLKNLPAEAVIDRNTRAWMERMGLTRGKG